MTKNIVYVVTGIIIALVLILIGKSFDSTQVAVGTITSGTVNTTAPIAEQSFNAVSSTTILSIFNGDDNARIINDVSFFQTGANASTSIFTVTCATSTTGSANLNALGVANTNYVLNTLLATSSSITPFSSYFASTSPGIIGQTIGGGELATSTRQWAPSSYLVCITSSTGGSTSGLFDAGSKGYIRFSYSRQ